MPTDYFTNEVLNYLSIIFIAAIPLIIVQYNKMMDRKRTVKEAKLAAELKAETDKKALELKVSNQEIAAGIKEKLEISQAEVSQKLLNSNNEIIKKVDAVHAQLNVRIDAITVKQVETHKDQLSLIADLQERADLTNGNVENIRNDLMDIEEIVEDTYQAIPHTNPANMAASIAKRRSRKDKRRQISFDSRIQGRKKHETGRDAELAKNERVHRYAREGYKDRNTEH